MREDDKLSAPVASAPSRRVSQGPVMPIGGAEATEPGGEILERFVDLAAPGDLVVVLVDRVTLLREALAQRAEQETSQPEMARIGQSNTSDVPPPQSPPVPNGRATSEARESQASREQRATA